MKTCPTCDRQYAGENTLCPADGTVLQKVGDDLLGQTLAGKYRIEERLDEGGMGTVYRATHILMEKTVAIKVLNPALAADEKIVTRFTREAKAASRISHPHALTVTDFGESENGIVFLVMEYLRGRTLKEVIRNESPLPLSRIAEILRQVCSALEAAHAGGVVHRDLKSDNIMLEEVGEGQDWAKVLDFGIAKIQEPDGAQDTALTAPNLIIGTPQYMSPEQCSQSSEIDARSDIYSLGVIAYEMLTGHVPFTAASPTAIMMKHLQEPPPSVLAERPDLSPAVGGVIARALSKRPEDRYQSVSQLAEAFLFAATDEPSVAADTATSTGENPAVNRDTERIIVPTNFDVSPRNTASEEHTEATVISAANTLHRDSGSEGARYDAPASPPAAGFNPWRVLVPAIVLLLVVFGVFFAFQRGSGDAATDEQGAPLTGDPNSQPVQAIKPPSGDNERDISPGRAVTSRGATPSAAAAIGVNVNGNGNVATEISPAANTNTNRNDNSQQSDAEERYKEAEPSPTPSGKNTNAQPTPPPVKVRPEIIIEQPQPNAPPARKKEPADEPQKPATPAQSEPSSPNL